MSASTGGGLSRGCASPIPSRPCGKSPRTSGRHPRAAPASNSQTLLVLAEMIDPDEEKPAAKVKLDCGAWSGRRRRWSRTTSGGNSWRTRSTTLERPVEVVVAEAIEKFGGSRSQCFRDLDLMRKDRKLMAELDQLTRARECAAEGQVPVKSRFVGLQFLLLGARSCEY